MPIGAPYKIVENSRPPNMQISSNKSETACIFNKIDMADGML